MTGECIAIVEKLTKRFEPNEPPALDGISFSIAAGQVTGVVGPDGAGKTTLMRLMAGLLTPTEGSLTVCGYDTIADSNALHQAIGYMPQRFGLYEDLSVLENLQLYADLRGVVGKARTETFERLLAFTDLARFTKRLAGKLSGGMKQKLGLACAMLKSPRLLLLDEPSVGVDPISRRELWSMVRALTDEGVAVVWSTAYLDEAENCAEVIVLNEGAASVSGRPSGDDRRDWRPRFPGGGRRTRTPQASGAGAFQTGYHRWRDAGPTGRLVMKEKTPPPKPEELQNGATITIAPARPRFEDAFVAMLGGQPKRTKDMKAEEKHAMRKARRSKP